VYFRVIAIITNGGGQRRSSYIILQMLSALLGSWKEIWHKSTNDEDMRTQ